MAKRHTLSVALLCALGLLIAVPTSAQITAVEISRDTFPAQNGSEADTQVEPYIAVDPNDPSIVVAVFQQGRFADGGSAHPGYATSHDGGQTWTASDLPLLTVAVGGAFDRASDPVVAFGPDGTVYAQTIAFTDARSAIAVQRSDDGGLTFGPPVLAQDDNSPLVFNDKNWIAVDTFPTSSHSGRVYVAWDQNNSSGAPLLLRSSDDRGQTWGPLINVSSSTARTLSAIPLVQPNGDLTIVYEDYTAVDEVAAQTSRNGGATFDAPVVISNFQPGRLPDIRSGALPAATVDAVTGDLYAVWQDRRFRSDGQRDIVLSRSTSRGASWSALTRVNVDAVDSHLDHFTPAVAALDGRVHVTYRTRDVSGGLSPLVDMRYILSADSGATFGGERVLGSPTDLRFAAQVTSDHCTNPPCWFLGDYMGVAVAEDNAVYPVWCRAYSNPAAPTAAHQTTWSSSIRGTCGDGVRDFGEACDGGDSTACPGSCLSDCTCPCTNEVTDPRASATAKTRKAAGTLNAKMVLALDAYDNETVAVRLDDGDSMPIVRQDVGALPAKGKTGKQWQYKVRGSGLQQVTLKDLSPRKPGNFQIVVKAAKWFTASAANESAATTRLTVTIGDQCFVHTLTKKTD